MSTKTIKQRVSTLAVIALTSGIISVVSVPSANATLLAPQINNSAVDTAHPTAALEGALIIATVNSLTGSAAASATTGSNFSRGLINVSDITGGTVAGTTQTATLLSTGALTAVTVTAAGSTDVQHIAAFSVENGTITGAAGLDAINTTRNVGVVVGAQSVAGLVFTPNSGATTMTIRMYNGQESTYGASASVALATATAVPSLGFLNGQITVTIASTSAAGVIAASKSGVYYTVDYDTSTAITADEAAGLGVSNAVSKQYASIRVRDTFGTGLAAGGLLQVSATNGAVVTLDSDTVGTASTAFSTTTSDATGLTVANTTVKPLSTTVTVTYNGVTVGTKTFNFWGEVARVVLSEPFIGKQGVTSGNDAKLNLFDAANNPIYFAYVNGSTASTFTPAAGLVSSSGSDDTVAAHVAPAITNAGVVTQGIVEFACGATTTKQNIQVEYVNNSGSVVKSNSLAVSCAGDAVSYKASYDKAVYTPGEIAKLTTTFFDSKGNVANDVTAVNTAALVISTSGMKGTAIVAPGTTEVTEQGKLSYNYIVDTTEGTFTNQVVASTVNSRASSVNLVPTAAATATLTVKAAGTTVTNAEVLKSIVSLIASINKQIQALQKLILRR